MFGVRGVPNQILNPYLHMKNLQTFCNIDLYSGLGNKKEDHLIQMILLVLSKYLQRFLSGRPIPPTAIDFQCSPSHCLELLWQQGNYHEQGPRKTRS